MKHITPGMLIRAGNPSGNMFVGRVLTKNPKERTVLLLPIGGTEPLWMWYDFEFEERVMEDPLEQIHPMLAKVARAGDLEKLLADDTWWAEPKFDGERQILTYLPSPEDADRDWSEFTAGYPTYFRATTRVVGTNSGRLGVNTGKLPHLAGIPVPTDGPTVFDVELLHHHGATVEERFRSLRSIMGSATDKALAKQAEIGEVMVVVFDLLWFNGMDLREMPFAYRRALLEKWFEENVPEYEDTFLLVDIKRTAQGKRELLDWLLENGWEGMMLKNSTAPYTDTSIFGDRSENLLKIKPFKEDDVIIVGFGYGTGAHNQHRISRVQFAQLVSPDDILDGMVPSILDSRLPGNSGYLLVAMGQTSGLTYEQEEMFRADEESFIGRVMEVRYQQRWPETGKMRHPTFVRLRDDKTPADCVYGRAE